MVYCKGCGKQNEDEAAYCSQCGQGLQDAPSQTQNQAPPPDANGARRLYRSGQNKWVAGVCGGLGEYFDIDATLMRILWIILTLVSVGVGIIAYLLLWALVPRDPRHPWPS
jgi:phage shock protein PspC (stress-responsive transcriptional regulator)